MHRFDMTASTKWEKNILCEWAKYKSTLWNLANSKLLYLNLFFYCIKIYDALLYQTHLSPTNAAANNSQMWHSMPVYLFDIKHSTVCCCTYNTGCSIQIWLFWHDNKYLGISLRGGGGGSYGHSNCCCSSSYLLHYAL